MSKFLPYILNLRGAAIFFVVGVHARGNLLDWNSHPDAHRLISTFFDAREGNGTIMFIFIGGFLFQYLTHNNFEFGKYIEKKFKHVILPYLLISIPIIAFRIVTNYSFFLPDGFNDQSIIYRFFYYIITGLHLAPFWFISAIALFYVSAPLFHALDKSRFYKYIFPLIFITCLFTYRSEHNANPFLSYLHYFPIYLMGMWASHYREKIVAASGWLLYLLVIAYVGVVVSEFTGWISISEKVSFETVLREGLFVFNKDIFKAVILCFIVMLLLFRLRDKKMPFLEILGEYSFGIFFVHCLYIYAFRRILISLFGPIDFSLVTYFAFFAFILLISTATVYFIKKLTGRYSRNFIGS